MSFESLELFHPIVSKWFQDRFAEPTKAQNLAWPEIANGKNVLVTAPTGSGKTLTAFLWAIDRLARGEWEGGDIRVLYISPMRALNNDIRRNLKTPLEELGRAFLDAGETMPPIRTMTRSGDTPQGERRRMLSHPPEILITTPESLNILLTSSKGKNLFCGLETVILDEVHAVAGSKRGTHLITAVERLTLLAGEFQRVALSATIRPLETIAHWVGGFEFTENSEGKKYRPRPVTIVNAGGEKAYDISVNFLPPAETPPETDNWDGNPMWFSLTREIAARVDANKSTLVFANSRRLVERLARLINSDRNERLVYSHHGSLSREIREVVEERLKQGELLGIVATNSLELGIDIGAIDEVLLVETPPSISSTVQRLGRAGHGVGETSRGRLYPIHPLDIVDAAVVVRGMLDREVEPLTPPRAPLDVLAQVVLSMTSTDEWPLDDLFDFLCKTEPFKNLSRRLFDLVIEMLAGKYQGARVAELKPRISVDRIDNTAHARPGTARLLYASGGTIPDRGYFSMRVADTGALVGELDEEFVWERSIGDTVSLGVQSWKIARISSSDVFVSPSQRTSAMAPFWKCEERYHSFWFAEKRGLFLKQADGRLNDPGFVTELATRHHLEKKAIDELLRFLKSQRRATGASLPHRHHLVVEHVAYPRSAGLRPFTVFHTSWGGQINRPFALALGAAYEQRYGNRVETMHDDGCVAVEIAEPCPASELIGLVKPEELMGLVQSKIESTGFFGANFRENAARALLLPKAGFGKRTPLWLNRERSKELMETVSSYSDFPILLETWRTCLEDEIDLNGLSILLGELADGIIDVSEVTTTSPSPFAQEVVWKRTNELMYEDDTPSIQKTELLTDLIKEVTFSPKLRPRIARDIIEILERKLHRTHPGYSPRDQVELVDWVKERVIIPKEEWFELLNAMERDWSIQKNEVLSLLSSRVVAIKIEIERPTVFVCAVEDVNRLRHALDLDTDIPPLVSAALDGSEATFEALEAAKKMSSISGVEAGSANKLSDLLSEWLRFYGPLTPQSIADTLAVGIEKIDAALVALSRQNRVVVDEITDTATEPEAIDADNLGRLLRLGRAKARPIFQAQPIESLPLFLADHHGLASDGDEEALQLSMERLFGYATDASHWEEEILPARLQSFRTSKLDELLANSDLMWFGRPKQQVAFSLEGELELFTDDQEQDANFKSIFLKTFPDSPGRFSFADLLTNQSHLSSTELMIRIWKLTWSGLITNDTFAAIRQGITTGFKAEDVKTKPIKRRSLNRAHYSRWRTERPFSGSWYRLERVETNGDALDKEELGKDRVRVLLDRYGLLFRELLLREMKPLKWRAIFRTLRILELSGEVIGGSFFKGIPGIQFISPTALNRLREGLPENKVYWMNAADPISPCGLGLRGLDLPRRIATTHLVFRGNSLVLVSKRSGKSLDIRVPPEETNLPKYMDVFKAMLTRDARPMRAITIEDINGRPAATSPYKTVFEEIFDTVRDHRTLRIAKQY
ncbi:MAG: DEAD/DEAH box helicase [Proteobacteria bacterium]|nr:DEAD/DEAH box helicase [Pseudomonadota bacterium]